MRIYLAGPEVFHPDAVALGAKKKAICARHGFVGLFPLDGALMSTSSSLSATIYAACDAMMRQADCGIFNLTPFRGASADVGTVFELGVMATLGKPVFAYTNAVDDLIDRLRRDLGLTFDPAQKVWRDHDGMMAEDFGNADNLMLDEAIRSRGHIIERREVPLDRRFTDMDGFEACLARITTMTAIDRESMT